MVKPRHFLKKLGITDSSSHLWLVEEMFSILVTKFSIGDSPATSSKSRVLQTQVLLLLLLLF